MSVSFVLRCWALFRSPMRPEHFNAFADDDEDRIAGLGVVFHDTSCRKPPRAIEQLWRNEACDTPDYIWALIQSDLT